MFSVDVLGINQDLSFDDGAVTNFVSLRLPSGEVIRAVVSDAGARSLIEARSSMGNMKAAEAPSLPPPVRHQEPPAGLSDPEEDAHLFGGDSTEEPEQTELPWLPQPEALSEPPPPQAQPTPPVYRNPSEQLRDYQEKQREFKKKMKKGPSPIRTVPKDDRGYPVPRGANGADPRDIVGTSDGPTDEDGVGQL